MEGGCGGVCDENWGLLGHDEEARGYPTAGCRAHYLFLCYGHDRSTSCVPLWPDPACMYHQRNGSSASAIAA